jgi:hypothetical protein
VTFWFLLALSLQDAPIEDLIQQLRSDNPSVREAGAQGLRKYNRETLLALRTAAKSTDQEISQRAQEILRLIGSDIACKEVENLREKLLASKSVKVRFEGEWVSADGDKRYNKEFSGEWILLAGDKGRCLCKWSRNGEHQGSGYVFLSDGLKMLAGQGQDFDNPLQVLSGFRLELFSGIINLGLCSSSFKIQDVSVNLKKPYTRLPALAPLTQYQLSEDDTTGTRELTFRILDNDQTPLSESRLWCDIKTALPLRRVVTLFERKTGKPDTVISERYLEWSYDKEYPEEYFSLPGHRK